MLKHKNSSGMTLLLLIIGFVVMSGLAASMSNFYNASNINSVNDIGYLNAYYLAESGVRYAKLKQLAVGSYSYSLGTTGNVVSLVVDATNGTTSTGIYSSNSTLKSTRIILDSSYKGPKVVSTGSGLSKLLMAAKSSVSFGGDANSDIYASSIEMNDGTNLTGSLTSTSSSVKLTVPKNVVGTAADPIEICSNSDVVLATSGNTLYGNVYAHGSVTIGRPVVGNVYASGNVLFNSNAKVTGDVYSQGVVNTTGGNITGYIHVNSLSSVTGSGNYLPSRVIPGTVDDPKSCGSSVSFPDHETPVTTAVFNTTSDYTFSGKSLTDKTYSYKSFTAGWGARLCFDLSSGYVNIFVSGDTLLQGDIYIKTSASQTCFTRATKVDGIGLTYKDFASKVYMDTTGSVEFGGSRNWFGTIYAGGNITFGRGNNITGALYSSGGSIGSGTPDIHLDYKESDYFATR